MTNEKWIVVSDEAHVMSMSKDHFWAGEPTMINIVCNEPMVNQPIVEHDVIWSGEFRGTNEDPREVGWCPDCGEVYDRQDSDHCVWKEGF